MSKSRLEKFLYALYSLDSSDLPNPLSRIEELYKCWVTGADVPTFEPLSRVEKYLMAILGAYDVDSLPNPLSRVEVLLYKLATGDDNLDDVKSFLSEHEELLAEIIRNGGVGGNIDIEYVLYTLSTEFNTLYNTAEKPIKSAILSGNTLVNIVDFNHIAPITGATISDKVVTLDKSKTNSRIEFKTTHPSLVANKQYTVVLCDVNGDASTLSACVQTNSGVAIKTPFINNKAVVTMDEGNNKRLFYIESSKIVADTTVSFKIMIIEGNYTNADIPYFEGMQSVKLPVLTTTGKNIFNINGEFIMTGATYSINGDSLIVTGDWFIRRVIDLKPNTTYTLSYENAESDNGFTKMAIYYNGTSEMIDSTYSNKVTFTTPSSFKDICVIFYAEEGGSVNTVTYTNIQIEESSVATEYEPYKSNILTVNEEVELRGIGEVKDELNLLTGEVVQSIYNLQLTGYENWGQSGFTNDDYLVAYTNFTNNLSINASKVICDKLNYDSSISITNTKTEGINIIGDSSLRISLSKTKTATLNDFINWIRKEQPVINFVAKEKSVKTVDLSVVNQDGNNTELSTFDDITHVILSSEGLIPEVELEVATKNEEVLNTMSLEMDDISTTQTTLKETSNTQSENVDATMIATTEIYEQLL